MKEIKGTYTATSKNFCSQWDRAIFSHKLISHKIINLKKQTFMKADKLKKVGENISCKFCATENANISVKLPN